MSEEQATGQQPQATQSETTQSEPTQSQATASQPQPASSASGRTPVMAYMLSALALALAAISLIGMVKLNHRLNAQQPPRELEHKLAAVEHRVSHVEELLSTSRKDMVRAELKKMLLNLRELSRLADENTRAELSKAEAVLMRLSSPATRVRAKVDMESAKKAQTGTSAASAAGGAQAHKAAAPQPSQPASKPQHRQAGKPSSSSAGSGAQSNRPQATKRKPPASAETKPASKAAKPAAGSAGKPGQAPQSGQSKPASDGTAIKL